MTYYIKKEGLWPSNGRLSGEQRKSYLTSFAAKQAKFRESTLIGSGNMAELLFRFETLSSLHVCLDFVVHIDIHSSNFDFPLPNCVVSGYKEKNAEVKQASGVNVGQNQISKALNKWKCKHTMTNEYGQARTDGWISSGRLKKRPDPVTGSELDDFAEWYCPSDNDVTEGFKQVSTVVKVESAIDGAQVDDALAMLDDAGCCFGDCPGTTTHTSEHA